MSQVRNRNKYEILWLDDCCLVMLDFGSREIPEGLLPQAKVQAQG
jgi:hypothetical protein